MMTFANGDIILRKAIEEDIETIRNLTLSYDNQIEIARLTKMTYKEYLTWHVFNSLSSTYLLYISGEIIAITGFGDDNDLFFLVTTDLKKNSKKSVKYFKEILESLMKQEALDFCRVFIDYSYEASIRWATRCGFKFKSLIKLDKEISYGVYEYKIQKDKLSL